MVEKLQGPLPSNPKLFFKLNIELNTYHMTIMIVIIYLLIKNKNYLKG